ncbi:MAG: WYL domain-containing protein [Mariprofundus sp.]|nr:WYL domain-containing protein [Mariprofundus sp.]
MGIENSSMAHWWLVDKLLFGCTQVRPSSWFFCAVAYAVIRLRHGKGDHDIWYSPITERRFPVDQGVKSTTQDTHELRWWLLGFGDQVEVLEPVSLRNSFRIIVRNMAEAYN